MKTYRHPETGHKQTVDDSNAGAIASLEAQGYKEWGAAEIKQRIADAAQKVKDAAAQLKAAQEEAAAPPAEVKPLNPNAVVTTEADDELASVTVETTQPTGETDVTTVPRPEGSRLNAPAVPKKPN